MYSVYMVQNVDWIWGYRNLASFLVKLQVYTYNFTERGMSNASLPASIYSKSTVETEKECVKSIQS